MAMAISELQRLCSGTDLVLPPLRRAAVAADGAPVYAEPDGQADAPLPDGRALLTRWAREDEQQLRAPDARTPADEDPFGTPARRLAGHITAEVDLDRVGGTCIAALRQEHTVLCLVRADHGCDVPALLNWPGACNDGMTGRQHQAVLRHFHERYGAELVTLESQLLELLVTRRPRTAHGVATAALEH
ncbi:hypothetical protein AQI88_17055 [Streptomyces cellostaticus]|uniref:DUF4253 domain-containing protein n=1 Tax=Streptomyces cellostaticus TaxID=67285 RepID=A0A101NLY9_9ACTN|nr:hypothetical protein AQI88_17055 [Streptomyces cellostaticus]GHI01878.1 hypothetical protein Scel_01990 [Streptomyces cellostaticus]